MLRIACAIAIFISLTASMLWRRQKAFIALKQVLRAAPRKYQLDVEIVKN